jgi:hypothetical protein
MKNQQMPEVQIDPGDSQIVALRIEGIERGII